MMSDGNSSTAEASPSTVPDHTGQGSGSEIDLDALVEKVYRLFVAEIRLGLARGETLRGGRS